MHVVLVTTSIDPKHEDVARGRLVGEVIPALKAAAGFVAGYWLVPVDAKGFSMIFFASEAEARQAAPPVGPTPFEGVTIDAVEFRAVGASA